jgi:hypothetical protein
VKLSHLGEVPDETVVVDYTRSKQSVWVKWVPILLFGCGFRANFHGCFRFCRILLPIGEN